MLSSSSLVTPRKNLANELREFAEERSIMNIVDSGIRIEDNVLRGKDAPRTFKYNNLGEAVLDVLGNDEDFVGLVDPVTDGKYTFRTMRDRSVRCALWMRAQGLQPGDVVSICSEDKLDTAMPCYAAVYIGAVFNPLNPEMNTREFCHMLNMVKPKMAFVDERSATRVADAAKAANLDVKIVTFGRVPGFFDFETIIAEPRDEEVKNFRMDRAASLDDTALILCTSGSTGLPKGVALNHKPFFELLTLTVPESLSGLTCLIYSPISWFIGSWSLFTSIFARMTSVMAPHFDEYSSCAIIERYKVDYIYVSPSMINRWLKSDAFARYDISSVTMVVVAGAALSSASQEAFVKHLQPYSRFFTSYGQTEVGGCISTLTRSATSKPGSSGRILDNVQLKVIDPVTKQVYGPNKTGEILVKTPHMMNGYYNNPQATLEAVDEEGWLHTGDLGYYDEDGDIFLSDRLKEMLKYRGHHISPAEVESVLLSHPGVKDAIVVGLSDPVDGDLPIAFVVKMTNPSGTLKEVTEVELIDLVASELSDTKRLRGGLRFVDSLPKTTSDKIVRKEVREMAKSMVNIRGR